MDINIASFSSIDIKPDEKIQVTAPSSLWVITSVSLSVADDLPNEGKVVLYAAPVKEDGTYDDQIAIAPLRVGSCEVVNVDYEINSASPIIFYTTGAKITVTINGFTTTLAQLKVEKIN